MTRTVTFRGSCGALIVDRATGMVIECEDDGGGEYLDIKRVDAASLSRVAGGEDDILVAGFWTDTGDYCEGMLPTMATHRWREYGSGRRRESFDVNDWQPVRLLPAPERRA